MSDLVAPVACQFEAYNRHDLDAFLACVAQDFRSYRMPAETPSLQGKTALAEFYAEHRFNNPALRAELVSRTVLGNKVFDHERIYGLGECAGGEHRGVRGRRCPDQDRMVLLC